MSCEPESLVLPARRTLAGWAALVLLAVALGLYAYMVRLVTTLEFDEPYRRTFVTGEFVVYPASTTFAPRDGLEYRPGTRVDTLPKEGRNYMERFGFLRFHDPAPYMRWMTGRLFLSVPENLREPTRPHRLKMAIRCSMPAGRPTRVEIAVNGTIAGHATCADGTLSEFESRLAPGVFPARRYDEIRLTRGPDDWWERVATRLGLRIRAVHLVWFELTPE